MPPRFTQPPTEEKKNCSSFLIYIFPQSKMKKIIAKLHARGIVEHASPSVRLACSLVFTRIMNNSHLYICMYIHLIILTMFILLHLQKSKSFTQCSKTFKLSNLLTMCLEHSVAYLLIQPVYQVPQLMLLTLERTNLQLTAFATSP